MKRSVLTAILLGFLSSAAVAQAPKVALTDAERIAKLEGQVETLQAKIDADEGLIGSKQDQSALVFLYMCFCGTLASTTGRNFWLWWFLGIFTFPTLIILLLLIGGDWKKKRLVA